MKVCLISPFYYEDPNVSRPSFVRKSFLSNGVDVITLTSDFSHMEKKKVSFNDNNIYTVKTIPYKNNKSIIRFVSHLMLSISLFILAFKNRKDINCYYVTSPFALTALLVKVFCKKKVIIDIVDFWPNSLPFNQMSFFKPFLFCWSKLNFFIYLACDRVISVSTVFLDLAKVNHKNLFLLGGERHFNDLPKKADSKLRIIYIGNIGTLYDFDTLLSALSYYREKIRIDIIGDGDRKEWLLKELLLKDIEFTYHGIIYDPIYIGKLANSCDVGFNGYINTNASFSYKAISYFSYGLPIINSMNGDLELFVKENELGFNYTGGDLHSLINAIESFYVSNHTYLQDKVKLFFNEKLEYSITSKNIFNVLNEVMNEKDF